MDRLYEKDVPSIIKKLLNIYGEMTTSEVIRHIDEVYEPTKIDLEPIPNRSDTRYTQTIRNLALHKKEQLKKEDVAFPEGIILSMDSSKKRDKYKYTLAVVNNKSEKVKLLEESKLTQYREKGNKFIARKVDFEDIQSKNTELGLLGEQFVLQKEIDHAESLGLTDMVSHVSSVNGDGAGYDIASVDKNGLPIYIEVKTTTHKLETPFYISQNEYNFFKIYQDDVLLYRVYNFDKNNKKGDIKIYTAEEILTNFNFVPSGYKVFKNDN